MSRTVTPAGGTKWNASSPRRALFPEGQPAAGKRLCLLKGVQTASRSNTNEESTRLREKLTRVCCRPLPSPSHLSFAPALLRPVRRQQVQYDTAARPSPSPTSSRRLPSDAPTHLALPSHGHPVLPHNDDYDAPPLLPYPLPLPRVLVLRPSERHPPPAFSTRARDRHFRAWFRSRAVQR